MSAKSWKHVSARIKAKHAFYVHCNAHCLNLVLVDTVKSVPEAACFFSLLQKLYVLMSGSCIHQKWPEVQREMYVGQPRELQKVCDTRWACRRFAKQELLSLLKHFRTRVRITGRNPLLMSYGERSYTQLKKAIPALKGWKKKRQRKTSSRLQGSVVTSTAGERRSDQDDKDGFRKNIFYPIHDCGIGELQKPNRNIMRDVQALHPSATAFSFAEIYESNLDDLRHKLHWA